MLGMERPRAGAVRSSGSSVQKATGVMRRLKPGVRQSTSLGEVPIIPVAFATGIMGNAGAAHLVVLSQVINSPPAMSLEVYGYTLKAPAKCVPQYCRNLKCLVPLSKAHRV